MFKKIANLTSSLFTNWLFTTQGTTVCGIVGGVIMTFLASLTKDLPYTPISYGMAFAFGLFAVVVLTRAILSVFLAATNNLRTKKETYIEYRVDKHHAEIVAWSNIYKTPVANPIGQGPMMVIQVNPSKPAKKNRSLPQIPQPTHQNNQQQPPQDNGGTFDFIVLFEKPIAHVRMAQITRKAGETPKLMTCLPDERWCKFILSEIKDGAYFRIDFNHGP